jgi:hypothetical protein
MEQLLFTTLLLLVLFQMKHFLADYPLQNSYMLGKFKPGWAFVGPLAAHAAVHAMLTVFVTGLFLPGSWWPLAFGLVDFVTHFVIDRIKASPRLLGRFSNKSKPSYWNCLGADQMAHHLVHYGIIVYLILLLF